MIENCKVNDCQQRELRAEIEQLRAALDVFLGDKTLSDILWGDLSDDKPVNITVKLGAYRKAQAARGHQQLPSTEK